MITCSVRPIYTLSVAEEIYERDLNKHGLFVRDARRITQTAWMLKGLNFLPTKQCDHLTGGVYSAGFFMFVVYDLGARDARLRSFSVKSFFLKRIWCGVTSTNSSSSINSSACSSVIMTGGMSVWFANRRKRWHSRCSSTQNPTRLLCSVVSIA